MGEICGGPHFTIHCPNSPGYSINYIANPFVQPQPYYSQGYPSYYYDDPYQQPQHNQGQYYYYDQYSDSNFVGGNDSALSTIKELLVQLVTQKADTQKTLLEHDIIQRNRQSALLDLQSTIEDIARRLKEEEQEQKVQPEKQPTTGNTYDPEGKGLPYRKYEEELVEDITPVTETKMDKEVPPMVPQVTLYDFGSDSDDEIDEEEWAAYQRSLLKKEVVWGG
ncbi:hypothetical protein HanRHA438_Chr05g0212131 [Helianthus annuus]|nr:hypothetical protein HanRHA438_Chr05g0212131 [Helianthus annuus]